MSYSEGNERTGKSKMRKKRILFVGTACVCFSADTPYIPAPGELITSRGNYDTCPGGHGLLSAIASGRLGGDPAFCACVGQDYYGDRLKEICKREGMHVSNVESLAEEQTALQVRLTEKDGTRRRIWLPGAASRLNAATVKTAFSCYPDAITVSSSCPEEVLIAASETAKERGVPFVLDEDPDGPLLDLLPLEKLESAELMIVNEARSDGENGFCVSREDKQKQLCYALRKRANVHAIVMRLGSKGCFLYDGKYFSLVSAPDAETVDPDGTEAVFTAAFVGEYLSSHDLLKASQCANAAAGYTASRKGGYVSLPERKEEN